MKLYIASSWRNEYYPIVVEGLRQRGFEVYDFRNPPSGGTFHSVMGGTFETDMPGTFHSATGGTFVPVLGGTFNPLLSHNLRNSGAPHSSDDLHVLEVKNPINRIVYRYK